MHRRFSEWRPLGAASKRQMGDGVSSDSPPQTFNHQPGEDVAGPRRDSLVRNEQLPRHATAKRPQPVMGVRSGSSLRGFSIYPSQGRGANLQPPWAASSLEAGGRTVQPPLSSLLWGADSPLPQWGLPEPEGEPSDRPNAKHSGCWENRPCVEDFSFLHLGEPWLLSCSSTTDGSSNSGPVSGIHSTRLARETDP